MEPGEIEALIECLVANPHDTDALARAHRRGETDPQSYAFLLEQVGTRTQDPAYASHWLSEAANIWSVTLGDAHRAARVLMLAVDKDPTQPLAAERLAQLYRDKGDVKALVAMLDRRVRLLTPMLGSGAPGTEGLRTLLAAIHEELGKLWTEAPLEQPRKAIDHYKRSIELDPRGAFAIFSLREVHKSLQQWDEAIALYGMELAVEADPARRLMLARDEAGARRLAGDLVGVTRTLRAGLDEIRASGGDDPILVQEVAGSILDRLEAGAPVDERERAYGADLLSGLAEAFDGDHGLAYAAGALDLVAGHDRAMQLYAYYGAAMGAVGDALTLKYHAYVEANPRGPMAPDARVHLANSYEAVGQIPQAVQVLGPLAGRPDIDERLATLQHRAQAHVALTPVGGVAELQRQARAIVVTETNEAVDTDEVAEVADLADPRARFPQGGKQSSLDAARDALKKGDKALALDHYLEVLATDAVEPEALSFVEDALRAKRDYAKLRDVLWASARAMGSQDSIEGKKLRLREIAGLSESNLKDIDGAVQAWRQLLSLDRGDDAARQSLTRALEKYQRWADLANLYEQEASVSSDVDAKVQLEKKLAAVHEQKRGDVLAAAEAWSRIADLLPDDEHPVTTAADLFEKANRRDLAVKVIEDHVEGVAAPAKAILHDRLGALLAADGADLAGAGRAFQRAAEVDPTAERWATAERSFASAEAWPLAATAAEKSATLLQPDRSSEAAEALVRGSTYLERAGDSVAAVALLERAHDLSHADAHADALVAAYRALGDTSKLARFLAQRGESHADAATRIAASREAAKLFGESLSDQEGARTEWTKVLAAGEDAEALEQLAQIEESRGGLTEAGALLARLAALATTKDAQVTVGLREAELYARLADGLEKSIERYERLLADVDGTNRVALRAIASLEIRRGAPKAAANALERELALAVSPSSRRDVAARLAEAYQAAKDDAGTFTALTALREADPEDFDALNRLVALAEKLERWEALLDLLTAQIDVEADEGEIMALTLRRSALLADKLGRGDEALAALQELADSGDVGVRDAYIVLGDRLGWRGIVATKLVDWWFPEAGSDARTAALLGALERFVVVGRDADAVRVGIEVLRGGRDVPLAQRIEALAAKTADDVGLTAAQEILGTELVGAERAAELVRQAEMRVMAKMAWPESVQHGETGLGGLAAEDVAPLLVKLAALIPTPAGVIDLYERQVSRARGGEAREKALVRAAQVAGEAGDQKRARTFFDLALAGTPNEATVDALVAAAGERGLVGGALLRTLAEALAQGGEGVRDGGRARAGLLRRAAKIAHEALHELDLAFAWLSDALIAHADTATLDVLESLAKDSGAPQRVEEVLTHVLGEVFDGPLVRLLLTRRAKLRKEVLGDRTGAAADLKKLHDLSPTDEAVMSDLAALLIEQGDHRSMVQLYEDQILRSKDQAARAELGRKVAQIWESELADAREAADAWRRVLRLKPGDEEATLGLDRAKTNMLRKSPAASSPTMVAGPPAAASSKPPLAPSSTPTASKPPPPRGGSVAPPPPPTPAPAPAPTPAPTLVVVAPPEDSVQNLDVEDLEEARTEEMEASGAPNLEQLLGSTDPFAEADTTHTSIDVRVPSKAAAALDAAPPAPPPAAGNPRSNRAGSRPPPPPPSSTALPSPPSSAAFPSSGSPPSYPRSEPPTSPGRRLDTARHHEPGERSLARTEENSPIDFSDRTEASFGAPDHDKREIPPDILSATDLAVDDDDDVLVVDEFVEDSDEYEDVAEPSKPPGPVPH